MKHPISHKQRFSLSRSEVMRRFFRGDYPDDRFFEGDRSWFKRVNYFIEPKDYTVNMILPISEIPLPKET